jgi:hypothetical protein
VNPLNIHINICANFTAAIAALAAAIAGSANGKAEAATNIIPISNGDTSPEPEVKKGRKSKAEKEEAPVVKVDQTKRLEELCEKAKTAIKSLDVTAGRQLTAKCKELAQTLGADKLSALEASQDVLDKAEAGLEELINEANQDDDV